MALNQFQLGDMVLISSRTSPRCARFDGLQGRIVYVDRWMLSRGYEAYIVEIGQPTGHHKMIGFYRDFPVSAKKENCLYLLAKYLLPAGHYVQQKLWTGR